jgi:hypothetical protein
MSLFAFASLLLIASGAEAKDFLLRYDIVEVEYAEKDSSAFGEPVSTATRHIEIKIADHGEFQSKQRDHDREMAVSGKAIGVKNGQLSVEATTFAYSRTDGGGGMQVSGAECPLSDKPKSICCSGGTRQVFVFCSARETGKTKRDDDAWCADAMKQMLDHIAKERKDRIIERELKEKTATCLLELAKSKLGRSDDDAVGRKLLQTVVQSFDDTAAALDAKKTWNQLPNVDSKYSLDPFSPFKQ